MQLVALTDPNLRIIKMQEHVDYVFETNKLFRYIYGLCQGNMCVIKLRVF